MSAFAKLTTSKTNTSDEAGEAQKPADFFEDSFTKTLLKACLSLLTFFAKFLTAVQFESIISAVVVVSSAHEAELGAVLDLIAREISTQNTQQLKLVFQAMLNSYESVIITQGIIEGQISKHHLPVMARRFFNQLVKVVIFRMDKDFCHSNYSKIFMFFKDAFELTLNYFSKNEKTDMLDFKSVELAIAESFQ